MTCIKDILATESNHNSEPTVRLYAEGVFYKAYEYSAYLFVHHIRSYRAKRKYYKSVHRDVVSTGFPISTLASLQLPAGCKPREEPNSGGKVILIPINQDMVAPEADFGSWRENIPMDTPPVRKTPLFPPSMLTEDVPVDESLCHDSMRSIAFTVTSAERAALEKLKNFHLEAATPMRCMLFVAELRQMVAEHGCERG
ncbi:hypothetical protein [Porphyromonas pogonae]|uniref:hypothetical protein n=1 Tax=Porphyromonas pogonae TaxID=867595 RepID=UPI002E761A7E|nr:hypothetical protein [Porphyromonas pogonae]